MFKQACFFLLNLVILSACSAKLTTKEQVLTHFSNGEFEKAKINLENHEKNSLRKGIIGKDQDIILTKDSAWLLPSLALLQTYQEDYLSAIASWRKSSRVLDTLKKPSFHDHLTAIGISSSSSPYIPFIYEQQLLRLYFIFTLLLNGDRNNALALLRQSETFTQQVQEEHRHIDIKEHRDFTQLAISRYLLAHYLWRESDQSNARILFSKVKPTVPTHLIEEDLEELEKNSDSAMLVFIVHNGVVPNKTTQYVPSTIASLPLLKSFLDGKEPHPIWLSLTSIPVPQFQAWPQYEPSDLQITIDENACLKPTTFSDIGSAAHKELASKLPAITSQEVARILLRQGLISTFCNGKGGETKMHADLLLLLSNLITKADTRQWPNLPTRIDLARSYLPQGLHQITIQSPKAPSHTIEINLHSKELAIIHIVHPSPYAYKILLPPTKS